jgi:hypothetical protein
MAEPAAVQQLFVWLGFNAATSTNITDVQGISSINKIRLLNDDAVETLCKALQQALVGDNPATAAPLRAEQNLKLACYWICHQDRLSCPIAVPAVTEEAVCALMDYQTAELQRCHVTATPPTIHDSNWPATMEALVEHLRSVYGTTGMPLAYVVRKNEHIPEGPDPLTNYATVEEEMIARAPHFEANGVHLQSFLIDHNAVWDIVIAMCANHTSMACIKKAAHIHNGCTAYQALYNHYLGDSNVDHLADEADRKLMTSTYCSKQKRWNFEKYIALHIQQHTVFSSLTKFSNRGIDEHTKIRYLLNGIKNPTLNAVKLSVMARPSHEHTFEWVVSMFKEFIQSVEGNHPKELMVASTSTDKPNTANKTNTSAIVEDRYYSREEYNALSAAQKKALHDISKKRSKKPRFAWSKPKSSGKRNILVVESTAPNKHHSDLSLEGGAKPTKMAKVQSNRDNAALTCQKS